MSLNYSKQKCFLENIFTIYSIQLTMVCSLREKLAPTSWLVSWGFCSVASEPVKSYFTRFLRVLTFCLGASKIVILKENGVVNGVVECKIKFIIDGKGAGARWGRNRRNYNLLQSILHF